MSPIQDAPAEQYDGQNIMVMGHKTCHAVLLSLRGERCLGMDGFRIHIPVRHNPCPRIGTFLNAGSVLEHQPR